MKVQIKNSHLVVFESVLFKTTTTLLIGEEYLILVDPNWLPNEIKFISDYIYKLGYKKKNYLYFTHSDYDHIIGYGAFKNFETIASSNFTSNSEKEQILNQISTFDDAYYITRPYNIEYPIIKNTIAKDGQTIELGHNTLVFWQSVGHNPDGLLLLDKKNKVLVVGDYLSNVEFPYIYTSLKEYKLTLNKIEKILGDYDVKLLISGHGDYTDSKKEMKNRLTLSRAYITQLESSIVKNESFNFTDFIKAYDFPIVMKSFHEGNVTVATKELSMNCDE